MPVHVPQFAPGLRVGILGGGQLSRMLLEAALRMGLRPVVYADTPEAPAARVCPKAHFGTFYDETSLQAFFHDCDLVVFENEFIRCDVLERAAGSVPILPGLPTLTEMRDKLRQKALLDKLSIPSAPSFAYDGRPLEQWIAEAADRFKGACVFKWGQLGYDGKGVLVLRKHAAEKDAAFVFCQGAIKAGVSLFAEALVDYERELAVVAVYSTNGEFACYPLVVSEQRQGICWQVTGPATRLGVARDLEARATAAAKRIADAAQLYGCFAIEFFQTKTGELLVNEIAPRVHNSGHYTQDCARTSQFENHWRAVLGLPLGPTDAHGLFVMRNLLGPAEPFVAPGTHLHWYDKKGNQPGRKLGHVNALVADEAELKAILGSIDAKGKS